jgi:hypothetical protein
MMIVEQKFSLSPTSRTIKIIIDFRPEGIGLDMNPEK